MLQRMIASPPGLNYMFIRTYTTNTPTKRMPENNRITTHAFTETEVVCSSLYLYRTMEAMERQTRGKNMETHASSLLVTVKWTQKMHIVPSHERRPSNPRVRGTRASTIDGFVSGYMHGMTFAFNTVSSLTHRHRRRASGRTCRAIHNEWWIDPSSALHRRFWLPHHHTCPAMCLYRAHKNTNDGTTHGDMMANTLNMRAIEFIFGRPKPFIPVSARPK